METISLPIIAIDGPGGVGKTTVARALAARLGYFFLSSGMIYRAMAWQLRLGGWDGSKPPEVGSLAGFQVRVGVDGGIEVNGTAVSDDLHAEEISRAASVMSGIPEVREIANAAQRGTVARIASDGSFAGVILEGRDIGTVVFPDASCKIFLTAKPEVRAERRFLEKRGAGPPVSRETVQKGLEERDARDQTREVAPLKPAADALSVDTSELSLEQVVEKILQALSSSAA